MIKGNYKNIHSFHLEGKIKTTSPLSIGSGENENSDSDILLDSMGNPFIPSSSLLGVLRHWIFKYNPNFDFFFGITAVDGKENQQSQISLSDLYLTESYFEKKQIKIRDGIRIDSVTSLTADGAKFDFEVLEKGSIFQLKMICKYSENQKDLAETFIYLIKELLEKEEISLGSGTTNGFGKIKLYDTKIFSSYIQSTEDIWARIFQRTKEFTPKKTGVLHKSKKFIIDFRGSLISTLIIGESDPEMVSDKSHIQSNGKPILSGTSLKGVIRNRYEKILNTFIKKDSELYQILKYFVFGFTHESLKEDGVELESILRLMKKRFGEEFSSANLRGILQVQETDISNTQLLLQKRIRIDRFTGGTINSALFDSRPQTSNTGENIHVSCNLDTSHFPEWKAVAGVLLLVMKDFWTGMLAIGGEKNIGRGRVEGKKMTVKWTENEQEFIIDLKANENGFPECSESEWNQLEGFLSEFNIYLEKTK